MNGGRRLPSSRSSRRAITRLEGAREHARVLVADADGTGRIIAAVRKKNRRARFWYTETGAIVKFASFGCSVTRAQGRLKYMFKLARRYDRYVERLYSYNWTGADCLNRFDAGLVYANGKPRPGYYTFKGQLMRFGR